MFAFKKGSAVDSWTIQIRFVNLRPKVVLSFSVQVQTNIKMHQSINNSHLYNFKPRGYRLSMKNVNQKRFKKQSFISVVELKKRDSFNKLTYM